MSIQDSKFGVSPLDPFKDSSKIGKQSPVSAGGKNFQKILGDKEGKEDGRDFQQISGDKESEKGDEKISDVIISKDATKPSLLSLVSGKNIKKESKELKKTELAQELPAETSSSQAMKTLTPYVRAMPASSVKEPKEVELDAATIAAMPMKPKVEVAFVESVPQAQKPDMNSLTEAEERVLQELFVNPEVPPEASSEASSLMKKGKSNSPFSLYRSLSVKKDAKEASFGEELSDIMKSKKDTRFVQEQPDLSYVNLIAGPVPSAVSNVEVKPTVRAPYIQEVINQMVDKLRTLEVEGKTETVVTIKNSSLFEGSQVILTGFNHATKEFNISFQNLSPAAKQLLDLQPNQNDLKMALAEKGFTVHIIVTTTESEDAYYSRDQQPGDGGTQGRGEGQRRQDEEEA